MLKSTIGKTVSLIALALPATTALAESKAEQSPQHMEANGEIVVTAQRRAQALTDVPMSIQAMSAEQLADTGISDLTSLSMTMPGYLAATSVGFTQVFIRGIGNAVRVGADPSVATFVDDVPRIFGSMADNLVDVERLEVLKGAQGGLYGRNATGGVINIVTRKPNTDAVSGTLRASYGSRNSFNASGYLNMPLSDKVAWSVSAQRDSHGAYARNIAKDNPYTAAMFPAGWSTRSLSPQQTADYFNSSINTDSVNTQDFWAVNSKLLLRPSENVEVILAGDYYNKDDTNGMGLVLDTPGFTLNGISGLFRSLGIPTNFPSTLLQSPGKFEVANGSNQLRSKVREYGVSATINWELPNVDLTSITAYRNQMTHYLGNSAGADINDVLTDVLYPDKHYIYQEVRAVSSFAGPLRLMGGATYLQYKIHQSSEVAGVRTYLITPDIPLTGTSVNQKVTNWTVYGEASYDLAEHLTLTASARYLHETNEAHFTVPVQSSARTVAKRLIPSATLSYALPDGNVYARWARGFKTGGVSVVVAPIYFPRPEDGSIFKPETVDTFEVGYRQSILNRKLVLSAAAFYNDFKNLQESARGTPAYPAISTAIINAESSRTWGMEGSATYRIDPAVSLTANVGYLNAKYRRFDYRGSTVIANFTRDGMTMPKSPEWQISFGANLDTPIAPDLRLVGNVLASYTSSILWAYSPLPGVIPNASTPSYWLTNARIGVKTQDDRYGFAISANNLFNQGYYSNASSIAFGNSLIWGNPRIIKGEFTVNF